MFGALLRIFSYGSMAVKGAKKARDAMSSEQAEAAKAIVKDPEGWGDSLSSGWDKVKDESFELKDAFLPRNSNWSKNNKERTEECCR